MAFLGEDCWKTGLTNHQLSKIDELEKKLDSISKDRSRKLQQVETLEQILESQKRKTEEHRSQGSRIQRDLQSLEEKCAELEAKNSRLQSDLGAKDSHVTSIQNQLNSTSKLLDTANTKLKTYQKDVDHLPQLQQAPFAAQTPAKGPSSSALGPSLPYQASTFSATPMRRTAMTPSNVRGSSVSACFDFEAESTMKSKAQMEKSVSEEGLLRPPLAPQVNKPIGVDYEEKLKAVQLEAECQRQNAESIRISLEKRLKEQEREHYRDVKDLQRTLTEMEQGLQKAKECANKGEMALKASLEDLSRQNKAISKEYKEKEDLLVQTEARKSKLEAELGDAIQKVADLQLKLGEADAALQSALDQKSLAEKTAQDLSDQSEVAERRVAAATAELEPMKREQGTCTAKIDQLSQECSQLRSSKEELAAAYNTALDENSHLHQKVKDLEEILDNRNVGADPDSELLNLRESLSIANSSIELANREKAAASQAYEETISTLEQNLAETQAALKSKEDEVASLQQTVDSSTEKKNLQTNMEASTSIGEGGHDLSREEWVRQLEEELVSVRGDNVGLSRTLQEAELKNADLLENLARQENLISDLRSSLDQARTEAERAETKLLKLDSSSREKLEGVKALLVQKGAEAAEAVSKLQHLEEELVSSKRVILEAVEKIKGLDKDQEKHSSIICEQSALVSALLQETSGPKSELEEALIENGSETPLNSEMFLPRQSAALVCVQTGKCSTCNLYQETEHRLVEFSAQPCQSVGEALHNLAEVTVEKEMLERQLHQLKDEADQNREFLVKQMESLRAAAKRQSQEIESKTENLSSVEMQLSEQIEFKELLAVELEELQTLHDALSRQLDEERADSAAAVSSRDAEVARLENMASKLQDQVKVTEASLVECKDRLSSQLEAAQVESFELISRLKRNEDERAVLEQVIKDLKAEASLQESSKTEIVSTAAKLEAALKEKEAFADEMLTSHRQEMDRLLSLLSEKQGENDDLKSLMEEFEKNVAKETGEKDRLMEESGNLIAALKCQVDELERCNLQLEKTMLELKNDSAELLSSLESKDSVVEGLQASIAHLSSKVDSLSSLEEEQLKLKNDLQTIEAEKVKSLENLKETCAENSQLRQELESLKGASKSLQALLEASTEKADALEKEGTLVSKSMEELAAKTEKDAEIIEGFQSSLTQLNLKVSSLEEEKLKLDKEVLEEEKTSISEQLKMTCDENNQLKAELELFAKNHKSLIKESGEKINSLEREGALMKTLKDELIAKTEKNAEVIVGFQLSVAQLKVKVGSLEEEKQELDHHCQALKEEKTNISEQLKMTCNEMNHLRREMETLAEKHNTLIEESTAKIDSLLNEGASMKMSMDELMAKAEKDVEIIEGLRSLVAQLNGSVSSLEAEKFQVNKNLEALEGENTTISEKLKAAGDESNYLRRELEALAENNNVLIEESREKICSLEKEGASMKTSMDELIAKTEKEAEALKSQSDHEIRGLQQGKELDKAKMKMLLSIQRSLEKEVLEWRSEYDKLKQSLEQIEVEYKEKTSNLEETIVSLVESQSVTDLPWESDESLKGLSALEIKSALEKGNINLSIGQKVSLYSMCLVEMQKALSSKSDRRAEPAKEVVGVKGIRGQSNRSPSKHSENIGFEENKGKFVDKRRSPRLANPMLDCTNTPFKKTLLERTLKRSSASTPPVGSKRKMPPGEGIKMHSQPLEKNSSSAVEIRTDEKMAKIPKPAKRTQSQTAVVPFAMASTSSRQRTGELSRELPKNPFNK